jgi:hypothetical protein
MICKSGKIVKYMGKDGLFVETIFSSIERRFGEYVYSDVRLKNMIQEMMVKAPLCNKMITI